ncbi:MAG: LamG-like jellyroll fold domain-containing protein [Gammaproteobacteria bacterium]
MKERNVVLILMLAFSVIAGVAGGQVITNLVVYGETAEDWSIQTNIQDGAELYGDRGFAVEDLPAAYAGLDWIQTANDATDSWDVNPIASFVVTSDCTVYVAWDDRDPSVPDFMAADWTDTGDVLKDDAGSPQVTFNIYSKSYLEGSTVSLGTRLRFDGDADANMYIVIVKPGDNYNPPPFVDAGGDQAIWTDQLPVQLAGSITDADPADGSYTGTVTSFWTVPAGNSNPGTVTFTPTDTTDGLNLTAELSVVPGTYEIMLQASDGQKEANDIVTIIVRDPADKAILAHWDMENIIDPNIPELVAGNDGMYVVGWDRTPLMPTVVPGVIGANAIRFFGEQGEDDQEHMLNPFVLPKEYGTLSHWCKTAEEHRGAIYFESDDDTNGWGGPDLEIHSGTRDDYWMFSYTDAINGDSIAVGGGDAVPGVWSHVVATWNIYGDLVFYVDGVEVDRSGMPSYSVGGNLTPTEGNAIIGGVTDLDNGRQYNGDIDEVKVFNWDMSLEEIRDLTVMGPLVADVDAGDDIGFPWKPGSELPLDGVVTDLGKMETGDGLILWETKTSPPGTTDEATFTNADQAVTTATFPAAGVYVLKLTVIDSHAEGGSVSDEIEVTVFSPTCAWAIADGLTMPGDLTGGPDGEPDCHVGLDDLMIILVNWGRCKVPLDPSCEWPF